jgi:streptogramin lyase
LSGKERLRQAEEVRRQAEEERARREKEQAVNLEEGRVRKAKETALAATELARASKPPALQPDVLVAVKPAQPGASRRFVLLGLAGLVIVALASGIAWFTVHQAGSITEFPIPTANSSPNGIAAGPDGNLWFTEESGKIGRISPSGTITEFPVPTASNAPNGIAAGPDGNLWFTLNNSIGRITSGK